MLIAVLYVLYGIENRSTKGGALSVSQSGELEFVIYLCE